MQRRKPKTIAQGGRLDCTDTPPGPLARNCIKAADARETRYPEVMLDLEYRSLHTKRLRFELK